MTNKQYVRENPSVLIEIKNLLIAKGYVLQVEKLIKKIIKDETPIPVALELMKDSRVHWFVSSGEIYVQLKENLN